jgi:hypothetical protein
MDTRKCRTVLLDDSPADTDSFGPHGRVANAIADMIQTSIGGRAVALEGTWGAGKSTVIQLLRSKMPGQVVIFDAWAHSGDPLRRAFLEQLVEDLAPKGPHWQRQLEILAKRIRITESRSTPELTAFGIAFAVLLLLVPVGAPLLTAGLRPTTGPSNAVNVALLTVGAVMLSALPALVLGVIIVCSVRHAWRRIILKDKRSEFKSRAIALFLNKTETHQRLETHETPEPTTHEFEKVFSGLMLDILSKPDDRVVIVVDNLDRISEQEALAVWSTLRVFLELCQQQQQHAWARNVWLIVPYDRPAISRLWKKPATGSGEEASQPGEAVSAAFLQKTFQVRFEIPPPCA